MVLDQGVPRGTQPSGLVLAGPRVAFEFPVVEGGDAAERKRRIASHPVRGLDGGERKGLVARFVGGGIASPCLSTDPGGDGAGRGLVEEVGQRDRHAGGVQQQAPQPHRGERLQAQRHQWDVGADRRGRDVECFGDRLDHIVEGDSCLYRDRAHPDLLHGRGNETAGAVTHCPSYTKTAIIFI